MSILTKNQKRVFGPRVDTESGDLFTVCVRYDDECNNGRNTFSITANSRDWGGCCHDQIAEAYPELAYFIKWHLVSSDGPLHYVANTLYHVKTGKLDYARSTAVWPEATDEDLLAPGLKERLLARLPKLLEEFKTAVESLGFTY
jgi:hypothetical protein